MPIKRIPLLALVLVLTGAAAATAFEGMGKNPSKMGMTPASARPQSTPAPSTTPETVAIVNGEKISGAEFDRNWSGYLQQRGVPAGHGAKADQPADPKFRAMMTEVLDNLIAAELLWQEAKKTGHRVDSKEVDAQIDQVKGRIGGPEKFAEFLKGNGITEKVYRDYVEKQLSIRKLVDETIVKKVTVGDKDVHEHYLANPDRFKTQEQVKASHVLVKLEKTASEEERAAARKKIEGVLAEAKTGADFAELAQKNSDCPSAAKGGDLGFFGRGRMVKPFEEAAFALKKAGDLSGIVESDFGYHIIKLTDRREAGLRSEKDVSESIRQTLTQEKSREAIEERIAGLRKKAKVEVKLEL